LKKPRKILKPFSMPLSQINNKRSSYTPKKGTSEFESGVPTL